MGQQDAPRRIAVIGAGIAGATAARALLDAGAAVTVFDKARGAGGRMSTRRAPPRTFDHGAQYFTARDPAFREVLDGWIRDGVAARWDGRIAVVRSGSIGDTDPEPRHVGVPGMSAVCKHVLGEDGDVRVRFGTRVGSVSDENDAWGLADEDGADLGRFDAVLVTTPPAQAVPLLAAAPDLAERVADVRMLPCWTVMAGFHRPLDASYDAAFVHDSPLGWIARDTSKPGRPEAESWVLQASPEWSSDHVGDDADDVAATLLGALSVILRTTLPAPEHLAAHRWMYARTEAPLEEACLVDARQRIAVAGDWCLGARVEAAFLSGRAAAAALS